MGDIRLNIARNIAACRKKAGLTQEQLASELGVKKTTVSSWERAANAPDVETLYNLTKFFGVTLDDIYGANNLSSSETLTLAAHLDGSEDLGEEELEDINKYIEFVKSRRGR